MRSLKIVRCYDICKQLDILVFLDKDKDERPWALSPASSQFWLVGDVEEPTHLLQRVGDVVAGVVVCPRF